MHLDDIDFAALYRQHLREHGITPRPAEAWDARADGYARNSRQSRYVADFLARMDLRGADTLLDVGCGPGTLALPLAQRLGLTGLTGRKGHVVALDYSRPMLERLRLDAAAESVDNIIPMLRAWEDDWSDVPVCDIAIASRSTLVGDLGEALRKLHAHARLRVYLTYLVGGHFVDPEIDALLDPAPPPMPDHFLVLGALHRMGIAPRIDFIDTPSRLAGCEDFEAFIQRLAWAHGPVTGAARQRLQAWYEADPQRAAAGGRPMRWAFIAWSRHDA
ncbi:class I SAM-dependent methyltransferase [Roseateles sp.]|uniref:class I SAM-dependent methyltransferase n=1 Tax=Roseateles sp. TaxID=1971397 RepID=UPI0039EBF884